MPSKSALDLQHQVGQLLIIGFDSTELSTRLRLTLATFQPGGIILFKRNIEDATQTHALLHSAEQAVRTPMFLCVDLEGGTVDRLRDVIAPIPSVADVAAADSPKLVRKHGRLIGEQVRALGFNTDFAPCVDLGFEASRSVLGSRTASDNPKQVIAFAREFLRGFRDAKVLGCGKHYPGLGEASLDSHHDLPSIDKPWRRLWSEDLLPYRELRKEFPFVMVAHAAYPHVTGERSPATLSKKWISDILKKKVGYRGLVVCDDLDMGGVLSAAPIEEAAVETILAGSDIALVCQKEENVWRVFEALYKRAESDRKFARLVAERSAKVLTFKKKSPELKQKPAPKPTSKLVDKLRRRVWEFTEEVRMTARVAALEDIH
jgi:beta-N-acetylhexosaminidase